MYLVKETKQTNKYNLRKTSHVTYIYFDYNTNTLVVYLDITDLSFF